MNPFFNRFRWLLVPIAIMGLVLLGLSVMAFLVLPSLLVIGVEGAAPQRVLPVAVAGLLLVGVSVAAWRLTAYGEFRPHWSKGYLQISGIFGILFVVGAGLSASTVLASLGVVFLTLGAYGVFFGIIGYLYGGGRGSSISS